MSNSKQPEYDMAKVQGLFVGYRKFAVDREWLRQQEEQRYRDRQRQFDEWSRKWVTVTRLKRLVYGLTEPSGDGWVNLSNRVNIKFSPLKRFWLLRS